LVGRRRDERDVESNEEKGNNQSDETVNKGESHEKPGEIKVTLLRKRCHRSVANSGRNERIRSELEDTSSDYDP
jgi:hypothetical protein